MSQPTISRYNLAAQVLVSLSVNRDKYDNPEALAKKALATADAFFALINDTAGKS